MIDTFNDHNPSAPWNQEELPVLSELKYTISQAYETGHEHVFYKSVDELREELQAIHAMLESSENGLCVIAKNKLNNLIDLI